MKSIWIAASLAAGLAASAAAAERTVTLGISGISCPTCPITLRAAIGGVEGVVEVEVELATKKAVVRFDDAVATPEQLAEASLNAGFPAIVEGQ